MPNPPQQTPTLEQLTLAYNEIQSQLSNAQTEFSALKGELDKTKQALQTAQMQLAKWKQLRDVATFNEDFQKIILDIPNISIEEQIDRYTRGLKNYIWKELCTKEYTKLSDAMRDAERVESAHKRVANPSKGNKNNPSSGTTNPVPMELGNVQLQKLTPEERQKCMKEGLCLRCREKGHMAKNCPKGRRN